MAGAATLGRQVGRGAAWSALNSFVLRLGQFAMGVVVARLVSPHDFGVFIVALTVYMIVVNVSEIGVSAAIVRGVDHPDDIAPTVATIAIGTSAVLTAVMVAAASPLASALGSPSATGPVRVIALTVLLAGPSAVPAALLTRDFRQDKRFAADLANFVAANGILIVLALMGSGVMALAWSRVVGQAVSTVLLLAMAPRRYRPGFDRRQAKRLLSFGAPLAGANMVTFTIANFDYMTVGRMLGAVPLGSYSLAFNIAGWPVSIFGTVLNSVALPAFGRVRGGAEALADRLAAGLAAVMALALPLTALCMGLAHPLVVTVYGERWAAAAPVLAVLALYGLSRVAIGLFGDFLVAQGKTRGLFALQLLWLAALVPAMILAVHWHGIVGAAWAHVVVATFVVLPAYFRVLASATSVPGAMLGRAVAVPLAAAALAGFGAHEIAAASSSPAAGLVIGGFAGCAIYLAIAAPWLLRLGRRLKALGSAPEEGLAPLLAGQAAGTSAS